MLIAFIHSHKSFLPEIQAYCDFFSRYGIETAVYRTEQYDNIHADVDWHILGRHTKKGKSTITIHEYASASIPPFRKEKNALKRWFNIKPDYRLFLNEYVKRQLRFKDNIPFGLRDMGIGDLFLRPDEKKMKEYDFIYSGSITADRQIEKLLNLFTNDDLKKHSLIILSKDYEKLKHRFNRSENIIFKGPVAYETVAEYISKSRFAVNFRPDIEPHNQQTAVKLLEYIALKIPVISSRFAWLEQFQQQYGGDFFYLENDGSNFKWENLIHYPFSFPDMNEWRWENQIRKSGVLEFLQSRFHELSFK